MGQYLALITTFEPGVGIGGGPAPPQRPVDPGYDRPGYIPVDPGWGGGWSPPGHVWRPPTDPGWSGGVAGPGLPPGFWAGHHPPPTVGGGPVTPPSWASGQPLPPGYVPPWAGGVPLPPHVGWHPGGGHISTGPLPPGYASGQPLPPGVIGGPPSWAGGVPMPPVGGQLPIYDPSGEVGVGIKDGVVWIVAWVPGKGLSWVAIKPEEPPTKPEEPEPK